jgi:hypothetical protein
MHLYSIGSKQIEKTIVCDHVVVFFIFEDK